MNFLAPYMLWGAAAASIPIILHFFFRSRYRTVPWAAMNFLLTSIEQTSRRLKFQELLLLLMRVAILVLLALALARPLSSAFTSSGGAAAVDAVFVFDTSFSMGAREGEVTRLDLAKVTALKILDQLPPYSSVRVIDLSARPALLGPRVPFNLDQARFLIENLQLTHLPTDFRPGIKEALEALKTSQMSNKELYFFSDMQKLGWETEEAPLVDEFKEIGKLGSVYLVRCGTKVPANVAVTAITPQIDIPRPGERVSFAVLVTNTGKEPAKKLTVTLMADGQKENAETQSIDSLEPGKTATVTLTAKMKDAGLHVISATVKQDELEADNRLDQVILVRDYVRLLIIDGSPNAEEPRQASSFYLAHALLPVKDNDKRSYPLQAQVYSARQAVPDMLLDKDICILVNAAMPSKIVGIETLSAEFVKSLETFVREGHGLMIFAGDRVNPADYNAVLVEQHHLLPFKLKDQFVKRPKESPLHFNRESAALASFNQFREDKLYQFLNEASIWQAIGVEEASPISAKKTNEEKGEGETKKGKTGTKAATVALRYDDGSPAIISHKVDAGEVIFFTTAAHPVWDEKTTDATWTNLPILPPFVPMMRLTVNHLLHQQSQDQNVVAGKALNWFAPPKDSKKNFVLYQPDGKKRQLGTPSPEKDRHFLKLENLPQAGIHTLVALNQTAKQNDYLNDPVFLEELRQGKVTMGFPIAVTPDLKESENLETLTDEQIDSKLGFPVIHATAGSNPDQYAGLDRTNREWTLWLLILVLCVAIGEAILAWFCGRPI